MNVGDGGMDFGRVSISPVANTTVRVARDAMPETRPFLQLVIRAGTIGTP
jgi:hypothetical protein